MSRQNSQQSKERLSATMLALRTANKKRPCATCLRKVGFGMTRTCRILRVGKATASRWYRADGIVIDPRRNGVALKGTGERPRTGIKRAIRQMRFRARRCLDKPAAKVIVRFYPEGCETDAQQFKWRYEHDIEFRLKHLLRRRIRKVIETGVNRGSSIELLGCTTAEFRTHIENQFEFGMTWGNQGEWHLDHKKPCAAFDLRRESDQRRCFHYTNYRPLWRFDNAAKSSWYRGKLHIRAATEPPDVRRVL